MNQFSIFSTIKKWLEYLKKGVRNEGRKKTALYKEYLYNEVVKGGFRVVRIWKYGKNYRVVGCRVDGSEFVSIVSEKSINIRIPLVFKR